MAARFFRMSLVNLFVFSCFRDPLQPRPGEQAREEIRTERLADFLIRPFGDIQELNHSGSKNEPGFTTPVRDRTTES